MYWGDFQSRSFVKSGRSVQTRRGGGGRGLREVSNTGWLNGGRGETSHARTTKMIKWEEGGISQRARTHTHTYTYIHTHIHNGALTSLFCPFKGTNVANENVSLHRVSMTKTILSLRFHLRRWPSFLVLCFVICKRSSWPSGLRAREGREIEKSCIEGNFLTLFLRHLTEKCDIYVVHQLRSKTWGRRKIVEDSGMRRNLFNKIIVPWSITCDIAVLFMCVKTYANKQSAAGSSQIIWFQQKYWWDTHYTEPTEISRVNRPSTYLLPLDYPSYSHKHWRW